MAEHSRYSVSDKDAGISRGVLKNRLGIKSKKQLNNAETLLLFLLFSIHKYFFSALYDWAGKVRTVNISKDGVFFAPTKYIDKALETYNKLLKTTLPKQSDTQDEISQKLAIIHNEFNIIHPFREGNGRTIRLYLDLIVASLGYDPIDWSKKPNSIYVKACLAGVKGEHEIMEKIIKKGLKKSK